MKNFYVYEFTPPEMKKGCDAFFGVNYFLINIYNNLDNKRIMKNN